MASCIFMTTSTPHRTFHLAVHIHPHQTEQQIKMVWYASRLVLQIIGNGSKERTRTFQAALYISLTKIANEGNDIKVLL